MFGSSHLGRCSSRNPGTYLHCRGPVEQYSWLRLKHMTSCRLTRMCNLGMLHIYRSLSGTPLQCICPHQRCIPSQRQLGSGSLDIIHRYHRSSCTRLTHRSRWYRHIVGHQQIHNLGNLCTDRAPSHTVYLCNLSDLKSKRFSLRSHTCT